MNDLRCDGSNSRGARCRKPARPSGRYCATHAADGRAAGEAASLGAELWRADDDPFVAGMVRMLASAADVPTGAHSPVEQHQLLTGDGMADIAGAGNFEAWIRDGLSEAGADLGELDGYAEEGAELIRASLAPRTYDDYQAKFAAFDRWCASLNISSLPARRRSRCT